jgi:hypothetical protein
MAINRDELGTCEDSTPLYWDGSGEALDASSLDKETLERRKLIQERGVPALVKAGNRAFQRELPELRKRYPGQWVAYHGQRRIGEGDCETVLWKACVKRGLKEGSFVTHLVPLAQ